MVVEIWLFGKEINSLWVNHNWYIDGKLSWEIGGGDRTRTCYLLLAKQPLYQVSYTPKTYFGRGHKAFASVAQLLDQHLVGLVGLEPTTPALSRRCSNQLSYRPKSIILLITSQCMQRDAQMTAFQQPISVSVWICLLFLERRWSSRTFRYGYLVTTSPQSRTLPW